MYKEASLGPGMSAEIGRVNATLVDDIDLSAPSYYRPVWPESDLQGVISDLEARKKRVESQTEGKDAEILKAQLRAIDYLYAKGDEAIDGNVANPLVDLVCLLSTLGDSKQSRTTLQLAIEGAPMPLPYISKVDKTQKPEQRTYLEEEGGTKEFRTISRFNRQLTTVIRSLYVLGEAAKHHPLIVEVTLSDYAQKFAGGKDEVAGTAMGLLEMLHVLGLTYDKRFYSLAEQLRGTILDKVADYTELKKKYGYSIVGDRVFWHQGEVEIETRRKMSYLKREGSPEVVIRKKIRLDIPLVPNWQNVSKKRQEIIRTLRGLTLFNSIKASAVNFTQEKAVKRVVSDRMKKADLTVQKRDIERKEVDRLQGIWRSFIEDEISEDTTIGAGEVKLVSKATQLILAYFEKDDSLSQKAKTNIRFAEGNEGTYYNIDEAELAKDPVFAWILALRNPYVRQAFGQALAENGDSAESFFLLLKVMAYEVLRKSLSKREHNFLFDPNYPQKIDAKSLQELFSSIEDLAKDYVPNIAEIAKNVVALGDSQIQDLLEPENLKKYRAKLASLTYKRILDLFWKDKSRAFTDQDKKKVISLVKTIAYAGVFSLLTALLSKGLVGIAEWSADKNTERQQAEAARLVALALVEGKEQELINFRVSQMNAARARVAEQIHREMERQNSGNSFRNAEEETRRAAEENRIPGEMGDRVPDAIRQDGDPLPPESERFGLTGFGRIYHLPESMHITEGDPVGYFPWDINVQEWAYPDINTLDMFWGEVEPFSATVVVDSIDNLTLDFAPDQLAYSMNGVNPEMYPPIGWRFVAVYQEGGKQPMLGPLGELYYGYDNLDNIPQRAVYVLEQVAMESLDPKINLLQGIDAGYYWPYFSHRSAEDIVTRLAGDPILQDIYGNFIDEVTQLYRRQAAIPDQEYLRQYSDIGIRYATQYANYTAQSRYYALGFQITPHDYYAWDSLTSLADQPENGYFCSVAAFAFRDFMTAAGIMTGNQPGIALHNFQGHLWGGMGHMNSIVFLPDGRVLEVDMTPYATERTPQSDLEWLTGRIVTEEDIRLAIEQSTANRESAQTEAPVEDEDAVRRMVAEDNRIRRLTESAAYISDAVFNQHLGVIISNSEGITEREIVLRAQNTGDIETLTQDGLEYMLLRRIGTNAQRVLRDSPSMLDIQSGRANADEVYREYRELELILADTVSLKDILLLSDTEISSRLEAMEYTSRSLLSDMETVGRNLIDEGRRHAEELAEYERTYREYYERTGRIPGEVSEEDRAWDNIEMQRARNAWLERTEIGDQDFQYLDESLLERLESDLGMFLNDLSLRIGDERSSRVERADLPAGVPSADDYSTLATQASEIGQLIRNREDLYSQFDQSAREDLAQLPSSLFRLRGMFAGTSGLSDEEQQIEATRTLGLVRRLDRAVENIRNPQTPVPEQQPEREHRDLLTSEQINDIMDTSAKLAVSASALAFAYLGLRIYKSTKSHKERMEQLKKSFSAKGTLTSVEKDIALSTVGHVCHLAYDKKFPQKAASVLGLIEHYSPTRHDAAVRWLLNEGADVLMGADVKGSYYHLAELANGRARGASAQEIRRYFPEVIVKGLSKVDTHSGNGNGGEPDTSLVEVPHEFHVIYGVSSLLLNSAIVSLHDDVLGRLGMVKSKTQQAIPYKIDDFGDLLREKYLEGTIPETAMPLANTIYFILRGQGEIETKPVLSD